MIRIPTLSRSPATAAVGSAVLIMVALAGVILAAGADSASSTTPDQYVSAPAANVAPLVLPKPCVVTKRRQSCSTAASASHRAKQVKKQPVQTATLPAQTVAPTMAGP